MGQKFTRKELYDLVWSQPMQTLAASFGMSDVALAKHCKRANIPVPERGYWAKKQSGKPAVKQALSPRFPGASDTVEIGGSQRSHWGANWREEFLQEPIPPEPVFDEGMDAVTKRVEKMVGKLVCPEDFAKPHKLVAKLLAYDDERVAEYARYKSEYNPPRYQAGIGRRRMLLVNAIFICMEAYGCSASMKTSRYLSDRVEERVLGLHVGSQYLSFIIEPAKIEKSKGKTQASDKRLQFSIVRSSEKLQAELSLEDGPRRLLEDRLSEIIVSIFVSAEQRYREGAVSHRKWVIQHKEEVRVELERMKEEERRQEQERLAKEAKQRVDQLLTQAADFHRAQTIRGYVASTRERLQDNVVRKEDFELWAAWALDQANDVDPVSNGTVSLAIDAMVRSTVPND